MNIHLLTHFTYQLRRIYAVSVALLTVKFMMILYPDSCTLTRRSVLGLVVRASALPTYHIILTCIRLLITLTTSYDVLPVPRPCVAHASLEDCCDIEYGHGFKRVVYVHIKVTRIAAGRARVGYLTVSACA